jgi:hypothetical protein
MSRLQNDQAFLKMTIPERMRDDLKVLAFLDGITLKAKVMSLISSELAARNVEIKEINERRQQQTG